jgi:hypothetical protein
VRRNSRPFILISRLLLLALFVLAWIAPPAYANTVECTNDGGVWDCAINVDDSTGVDLVFTLTETTTVTFTTYTSLTCGDHGTGNNTGAYAADPYIYLFNDSDELIGQDDDSAGHNDGQNLCWDSHLQMVDLAPGTYRLNANVYGEEYGAYSMDITGVTNFDGNEPEPTPTPEPTPEPTVTPTPEPTPTPSPTPTETPAPTPTLVPTPTPQPTPLPSPTPLPPTPTPTMAPIAEPTAQPTSPVLVEQPPLEDDTTLDPIDLDDIDFDEWDWDDTDFDPLPPIEEDIDFEDFEEEMEFETENEEPDETEETSEEETTIEDETGEIEQDLEDIFTEEELEELDEGEIELLEELLDDPEIDEELVEDLEEIFDGKEITEEEISQITENADYEQLPPEAREQIVEAVNESTIEVREEFEENVDVFSSEDYAGYVQVGSRINVEDRKTIIVVTAAATAISSTMRPTATTTSAGPTAPTRRVKRD